MGLICTTITFAQTPAFPGAEGHGRYVTGGRGGEVRHVTNLNDSGSGSFRAAVSGNTKKIVVFDVAGVIALNSDLSIGDNTTIEGQTAPSPGITLRYYTVHSIGNNVIIRFVRSRRGQEKDTDDGADAIWERNKTGIILDHCSFSWSIDEVASFYDNNNFTMQWCTIGESLNNAGHGKGAHGYGGIWGGKLASFHHNLILHVNNRSPRFNGARYNWTGYTNNQLYGDYNWQNAVQAENVDLRNCVVYNANGCYGGPGGGQVNMVGNYFKSGPAASIDRLTTVSIGNSGNDDGHPEYWGMNSRYYLDGNTIDGNNAGWEKMRYDSDIKSSGSNYYTQDPNHYYGSSLTYTSIDGVDCLPVKLTSPAPTGEVTTHTAQNAFDKVLTYAGASMFKDNVDKRYSQEAKNGTATYTGSVTGKAGRIDLVSDANGYTESTFGTAMRAADFDADNDGMADAWETANGGDLEPNAYTLDSRGWYTNIEVYCNSLVQDIMQTENQDAQSAVDEYYPECQLIETGSTTGKVEDVSYTISKTTNIASSNTTSSWGFNDGISVTNSNNKEYQTGNNNGIKYSAGVKYTIVLPAGVSVDKITFSGYDNYADADSYIGELNGTAYGSTDYVFPKKTDSSTTVTRNYDIEFATPAMGTITFTPMGKQVVWNITLTGTRTTSGINTPTNTDITALPVSTEYYNVAGQRINSSTKGILIEKQRMQDGTVRTSKKVKK